MLTVAEAFEQLLATIAPFDVTEMPLHDGLGLCLGRDVHSASDLPPFDKSLMDGYAIHAVDLAAGQSTFRVIEVITAGQIPRKTVGIGEAAQIMTGAPLPEGADTVIKVEQTRRVGETVEIASTPVPPGTNVILRGTSARTGESVLRSGSVLNGARIGALAEMGYANVPVRRRPHAAVLATGNELVPIEAIPGPGQIRNSNASMLVAQIEAAGGMAVTLGIARDERDDLRAKIRQGLNSDLLILSGGVSAGTLDLVPSVLSELGVREVFHKVEMKPGKPVWFGEWVRRERQDCTIQTSCAVFGLPGNPVSSLVCCELFVRTAIRRMMGIEPATPQSILARLEHEHSTRAAVPTYHPAKLTWTAEGLMVSLVTWHGSSDLCGTAAANGMAYLPKEARHYQIGDRLETFAW